MIDTIFALDSSGKTAGVCILQQGTILAEEHIDLGLTHSETLLPLAQRTLAKANVAPENITLWAVTAGPGSFTGLRIGMALIKGMAMPFAAPLAAVSTLWALALACGLKGTVIAALNARRGEVYWAAFSCSDVVLRLTPDAATPVEDIAPAVQSAIGPIFFVGDGAEICYTVFNCSPHVLFANVPDVMPIARGAAMAGKIMLQESQVLPSREAYPQYLRVSQAERERTHTLKKTNGSAILKEAVL